MEENPKERYSNWGAVLILILVEVALGDIMEGKKYTIFLQVLILILVEVALGDFRRVSFVSLKVVLILI